MRRHARTIRSRQRAPRGLTLIEVVLSMLVLAVLTAGVLDLTGANAKARAIQADEARGLSLAQDLLNEILQHAYQEPGVTSAAGVESPEGTLASEAGMTGGYSVTESNWTAQYINPALPANTLSWSIRRVKLDLRRIGTIDGIYRIQLRAPTESGEPSDTVLASVTYDETNLAGGWSNPQPVFDVDGLTPGVGVFLVIEGVSGSGGIIELAYDPGGATGRYHTTDGGETWAALPGEAVTHYVYGTTTKAGASGSALSLGPDAGENAGDRSTFDDVDDFNAWEESSATLADGSAIAGATGWSRTVQVQRVTADGLVATSTESGLKRISVKVTNPAGKVTQLVSLRGRAGVSDQPDSDTTFTSLAGVTLSAGTDAPVSLRTAASTLNDPQLSTDANLVLNADFEQGLTHWEPGPWETQTLSSSTSGGHDGGPYARVTNIGGAWAAITQDMTGLIENGGTYAVSCHIKTDGVVNGTARFGIYIESTGSGAQFFQVTKTTLPVVWNQHVGSITPTWSGDLIKATFFVSEQTLLRSGFRVDDVGVVKQ